MPPHPRSPDTFFYPHDHKERLIYNASKLGSYDHIDERSHPKHMLEAFRVLLLDGTFDRLLDELT